MKKKPISICSLIIVAVLSLVAVFTTSVFATEFAATTKPGIEHKKNYKNSSEHLKKILNGLVADKTISQADADKAYALATADDKTKADFSKLPQAIKDALKAKRATKVPFGCEGLTESQRTKIRTAINESYKNAIDSLVKDSTITQEQADKIIANREKHQNRFKNNKANVKSNSTGITSN
jgi:predicted nucleic-acid-binding protein